MLPWLCFFCTLPRHCMVVSVGLQRHCDWRKARLASSEATSRECSSYWYGHWHWLRCLAGRLCAEVVWLNIVTRQRSVSICGRRDARPLLCRGLLFCRGLLLPSLRHRSSALGASGESPSPLLAAVFHIGPILLLPPRWRPYSPSALFSESGSRTRSIHQSWTETRPVSFVTLVCCGHV